MVVKLRWNNLLPHLLFESSVISYGSKAAEVLNRFEWSFESSVISYGSKAHNLD